VSFETLEHLYEQERFLAEIRRVLRPDGLLVISSPDSEVYSHAGSDVNPYHVRELSREEFKEKLSSVFPYSQFYSQRALVGSALTIEGQNHDVITFERRSDDHIEASNGLPRAPYIVALASQRGLDMPRSTLYIDLPNTAYLLMSRFSDTAQAVPDERLQAFIEETAALKAALAERDAAIGTQRMTIGDVTRQRDAAQLKAAEAVHGELARLRDAVNTAERHVQECESEIETGRRERAGQRDALAAAERRAHEQERLAVELKAVLVDRERGAARRLTRGLFGPTRRRGPDAAIRAAAEAHEKEDWPAALRDYRRALELAPERTTVWLQFAHALRESGDPAGAEAAYRRVVAMDPAVADAHLQLGRLLEAQAKWDEAGSLYDRAWQLDPQSSQAADCLRQLGSRLIDEGDKARDVRNWAVAARYYRQGLERQPDLTGIWVQLGHALKEQGDYAGAEAAYRRALVLEPKEADTHLQLGHLLKLKGHRDQAIGEYATAFRLDPELAAAGEELRALLGYSPSETDRAMTGESAPHIADMLGPPTPAKRYGALFAEASRKTGHGRDMIWLGVIDWNFRIQRPQHLAANLADAGARIFYVSLAFEPADAQGRFRILDMPHPGVFEIRMRLASDPAESVYRGLSEAAVGELQLALDEAIAVLGIAAPVVLVEHPAWHKVACGVPGATVVYDCLDLATGFTEAPPSLAEAEAALLSRADLVVTASRPLAEHLMPQRSSVIIRNAADFDFFAQGFTDRPVGDRPGGERPVIGYFGAIADWFNIGWIEACATARPDWDFRLIGRTSGCDTSRAAALPNVRFYGERPYRDLPTLLSQFDVALIPFKINELIRCTNPVKLYEYMAAGKPVVAAPMPEVIEATDLVYIADDLRSFSARIAEALAEDTPVLRARRREWASQHTWPSRVQLLAEAIEGGVPPVSVIILAYNNWEYTQACLASVRRWSDYPNLEIIVVDNASSDQTRDRLQALADQDDRIKIVLNDTNLGFAGGNNAGLRVARGEYVILLNNDTVVTHGWVRDLIRPMQRDPTIGLAGPLTNNIGNEQKIKAGYRS
ncbi:MAG TPA: glycosyltransferase, partial [Stellaceae bacterium]|nr:glycosyltransferase [Stellaceae bacterium]